MGIDKKIEKQQQDYIEVNREIQKLRRSKFNGSLQIFFELGKINHLIKYRITGIIPIEHENKNA